MADFHMPVIERIHQDIVDTLKKVRRDAGWNETLIVERRTRRGNDLRDGLCVVHAGDLSRSDELSAQNCTAWRQLFVIEAYIIESESSTKPLDQRAHTIRAEIEKALLEDVHRNCLAVDTQPVGGFIIDDPENRWQGMIVNIDVIYRTPFGDPYTNR